MNSSVADTKRYNSLYEATDEMNGYLCYHQKYLYFSFIHLKPQGLYNEGVIIYIGDAR